MRVGGQVVDQPKNPFFVDFFAASSAMSRSARLIFFCGAASAARSVCVGTTLPLTWGVSGAKSASLGELGDALERLQGLHCLAQAAVAL